MNFPKIASNLSCGRLSFSIKHRVDSIFPISLSLRNAPIKTTITPITSVAQIALDRSSLFQRFISFLKESFFTMFNWKYVKIANTNILVNINSVVKRIGLATSQVKEFAKNGNLEEECRKILMQKILKGEVITEKDHFIKLNDEFKRIFNVSLLLENGESCECFFYHQPTPSFYGKTFYLSNRSGHVQYYRISDLTGSYRFSKVYVSNIDDQYHINLSQAEIIRINTREWRKDGKAVGESIGGATLATYIDSRPFSQKEIMEEVLSMLTGS